MSICRPKLRFTLFGLFVLSLQPAAAVEDCFSSHCTGLESVTGHAYAFFTLPQGGIKKSTYFRHAGDIDFDVVNGPELFAIVGRTFWRNTSPTTREDVMKLRLQVRRTDNMNVISNFSTVVISDEYVQSAIPGYNMANFFSGGTGIINGAGGTRHIGMIFQVQPVEFDGSGFVVAEVRNMNGSKRWRKEFPMTSADDKWQLLSYEQVSIDDAALYGDFLGGGDMVDELRLVYFKKAGKQTQTFRYDYYNVKTGKKIRSDTFSVQVP